MQCRCVKTSQKQSMLIKYSVIRLSYQYIFFMNRKVTFIIMYLHVESFQFNSVSMKAYLFWNIKFLA